MVTCASQEEKILEKYNSDFQLYYKNIEKIALKYVSKYNNIFEAEELINHAWIKGRLSQRFSKREFLMRVNWDMLDFIRNYFGRDRLHSKEKTERKIKKHLPKTNYHNSEDVYDFFDQIPSKEKNIQRIYDNDLLKNLLKWPSLIQLEIVFRYYFEEKTCKEVGKDVGLKESQTSIKLQEALKSFRNGLKIREYFYGEI